MGIQDAFHPHEDVIQVALVLSTLLAIHHVIIVHHAGVQRDHFDDLLMVELVAHCRCFH